jgi:hypothetical protein
MLHTNEARVRGRRSPRVALGPARRFVHRLATPAAVAALLLHCGVAGAAPYVPGPGEPDPPTGVTVRPVVEDAAPTAPPVGDGIQWRLAPVRYAGTVSLDGRWLRLDDGSRSTQALLFNEIEFASYVWQPWFIQLNAGLGALAGRDSSTGPDAPSSSSSTAALTGHFGMAVFPASRFPFELRAEVSDSRLRGDFLGSNYRSHRLSLNQSYRPEVGNDNYNINFEYSRLNAGGSAGGEDTLSTLRGTALREFGAHSFDFAGQVSVNDRTDTGDSSRIALLNARHTYNPASALHVDSLASWNEVKLRGGRAENRFDSASDIRQVSSFATWRPLEGEWLYSATSPLYLTGNLRFVDAGASDAGVSQRTRATSASLGASQELTREWRLAGSLSASMVDPDRGPAVTSTAGDASVTFTPVGLRLGEWSYTPSAAANVGVSRAGSVTGTRTSMGGQVAHSASRSFEFGETSSLSFSLSQSLGVFRDSQVQGSSRALSNSAGMYWQGTSEGESQTYASVSASDSRTWAQERGSFQLVNLQLSRRTQLSRHASWSGNLTWQASRSDTTLTDFVTGLPRQASPGWQRFANGSLNYENQRVMGVPRLRFSALLALSSQQLESRAAGDINAPRERITESIETRLDYSVGRLEARLSARLARIEGRNVTSIFARVQRHY